MSRLAWSLGFCYHAVLCSADEYYRFQSAPVETPDLQCLTVARDGGLTMEKCSEGGTWTQTFRVPGYSGHGLVYSMTFAPPKCLTYKPEGPEFAECDEAREDQWWKGGWNNSPLGNCWCECCSADKCPKPCTGAPNLAVSSSGASFISTNGEGTPLSAVSISLPR